MQAAIRLRSSADIIVTNLSFAPGETRAAVRPLHFRRPIAPCRPIMAVTEGTVSHGTNADADREERTMSAGPVLSLRGITKTFPGVTANDHVDFDVYGGEVHALVG